MSCIIKSLKILSNAKHIFLVMQAIAHIRKKICQLFFPFKRLKHDDMNQPSTACLIPSITSCYALILRPEELVKTSHG